MWALLELCFNVCVMLSHYIIVRSMPEVIIEVLGPEPLCTRCNAVLNVVNKVIDTLGLRVRV